jgi:hypothetical protein
VICVKKFGKSSDIHSRGKGDVENVLGAKIKKRIKILLLDRAGLGGGATPPDSLAILNVFGNTPKIVRPKLSSKVEVEL